jgi:hypothetical protein
MTNHHLSPKVGSVEDFSHGASDRWVKFTFDSFTEPIRRALTTFTIMIRYAIALIELI